MTLPIDSGSQLKLWNDDLEQGRYVGQILRREGPTRHGLALFF